MKNNVYECMFLLDPNKVAGDHEAVVKQLHTTLEKNNAEVLASRVWEKDGKLKYPIRKQKKGMYYLTYFRTDSKNIVPIERDFSLNETILRNLVIRVELKLVDKMLEVGKNERMNAFQTAQDSGDDDLTRDEERMNRRGGRRGGPPDKDD